MPVHVLQVLIILSGLAIPICGPLRSRCIVMNNVSLQTTVRNQSRSGKSGGGDDGESRTKGCLSTSTSGGGEGRTLDDRSRDRSERSGEHGEWKCVVSCQRNMYES